MKEDSDEIAKKPESCRILIVDDEEIALKRMKSLMEKQGYRTHAVSTGEHALDLLKTQKFDLVLTDLILDTVDGLEILAYVKSESPETEVVIITDHASDRPCSTSPAFGLG